MAVALTLAACNSDKRQRTEGSASGGPVGSTSGTSTSALAVTEHGIGPLRAGMTIAEARSALGQFDVPTGSGTSGCTYASRTSLPAGVLVMVEDGIVGRIDVDTSLVPTAEGARVGDSEDGVRTLYGARLTVSPHKYTDGHYLTVKSASPIDTLHRIIFETKDGRVVRFRAGRLPQVQYVEGCS